MVAQIIYNHLLSYKSGGITFHSTLYVTVLEWKTQINQRNTQKLIWYVTTLFLNQRGINMWTHSKDGTTWLHLYGVFTYISRLIEKDLYESRNISFKFPCALFVYLCLSSGDLFIFFSKMSPFLFLFVDNVPAFHVLYRNKLPLLD